MDARRPTLRLRPVRRFPGRPGADPLPQRHDLAEVVGVMDRHTIQLVGQCHARLQLVRQPRGRLLQRCRSASAVQEHSHQVVPLILVFARRSRVPVAVRVARRDDTLLVRCGLRDQNLISLSRIF